MNNPTEEELRFLRKQSTKNHNLQCACNHLNYEKRQLTKRIAELEAQIQTWALLDRIGGTLESSGLNQRGYWLEPAVGNSDIIKAVDNYARHVPDFGAPLWDCLDIRADIASVPASVRNQYCADFLNWEPTDNYSVVMGNPPFTTAQEFIERAIYMKQDVSPAVFLLLRLGMLESGKRAEWWQGKEPDALYVLAERPDFTGGGGDATAYAWFAWNWIESGIFVLPPFSDQELHEWKMRRLYGENWKGD